MSDTQTQEPQWCPEPSDPDGRVDKDGFRASFYRGFVSRLEVEYPDGRKTPLYQQGPDGPLPFCLPQPELKPDPVSHFAFEGGPNARDIKLVVQDPKHEIAEIRVRFKTRAEQALSAGDASDPAGNKRGGVSARQDEGGETVVMADVVVLCPPNCASRQPA